MSCEDNDLGCKVFTIEQCTRKGDTVDAICLDFDVDISTMVFYMETRNLLGKPISKKKVGQGLTIEGTNRLKIDAYLETKHKGSFTTFLKVEDAGEITTILKWNNKVNNEEVKTWI